MNNETYEALKRVINRLKKEKFNGEGIGDRIKHFDDINQIEGWIDEVAKEYEPETNDVYEVISNQRLYFKKTDGGAEYLCTKAIEGTNCGDITTAVIRLDGGAEVI